MTENDKFLLNLAAIVFFIWWCFGLALTFRSFDEGPVEKTKSSQDGDKPTAQHNRQTAVPSSPNAEGDPDRRKRQEDYSSYQRRQIEVSAGLNVLTSLAAIAGIFGLYILFGTLTVAQTTADAAKKSADADVAATRAWLEIVNPDLPKRENITTGTITLKAQNVGKTPAFHISVLAELVYADKAGPVNLKACPNVSRKIWNWPPIEADKQVRIVSPPIPIASWLRKDQIDSLQSRAGLLAIHGCIYYKNVGHLGTEDIRIPDIPDDFSGMTEFCQMAYMPDLPEGTVPWCLTANEMR